MNVTPTGARFTNQRLDDTLNLYNYNARYYDHWIGRFITADTIVPSPERPQSFNRLAYVYNNPVKFIDPNGHMPQQPIPDIDGGAELAIGFSVLVLAAQYIPADILRNWDFGRMADWQSGRNIDEMWAMHAANEAARMAKELISTVSGNEDAQGDIESSVPSNPQSEGLERDLENNGTGQPLGTPTNLPSPDASAEDIQEALGSDWSPPVNPKANWTNEGTKEWLRSDNTHEGDPHWDYNYKGSNERGWRIRPDGIEPK